MDQNPKDFVAISISDTSASYPPNAKLYCNLCNCNLTLLDPQTEECLCTRCNVSYYPNKGEKVKRTNKFETPGPLTDKHGNIMGEKMPLVPSVNDNDVREVSSISYLGDKKNKNHLPLKKWKDMI
jgi:hypothetical protein